MSLRTMYECDGCKARELEPVGWHQVSFSVIGRGEPSTMLIHACVECSKRPLVELSDRVLQGERKRRAAP